MDETVFDYALDGTIRSVGRSPGYYREPGQGGNWTAERTARWLMLQANDGRIGRSGRYEKNKEI